MCWINVKCWPTLVAFIDMQMPLFHCRHGDRLDKQRLLWPDSTSRNHTGRNRGRTWIAAKILWNILFYTHITRLTAITTEKKPYPTYMSVKPMEFSGYRPATAYVAHVRPNDYMGKMRGHGASKEERGSSIEWKSAAVFSLLLFCFWFCFCFSSTIVLLNVFLYFAMFDSRY